jgi:hypothetical protein
MEGEKKYTKVKLFLSLIFIVFAVLLLVTIVRIMQDLFTGINEKNYEFKCNDLRYELRAISYKEKTLSFEMLNEDTDINITKITISAESGNYEYDAGKEIAFGSSLFTKQNNITVSSGFGIRVNDCQNMRNFTLK